MRIQERTVGDVIVLDVTGRISASVPERPLLPTVRSHLAQGRTRIVVNMHEVPYVDSTGLADIVVAFHAAAKCGGALKLAQLTAHVHELLRITMLLTVFEVFETEADAVASFGAPTA